jgi:Tol biopolymer transport system component
MKLYKYLNEIVCVLFSVFPASLAAGEMRLTEDGRFKTDPVFVGSSTQGIAYVVQERPTFLRLLMLDLSSRTSSPIHTEQEILSEFEIAFSPDGKRSAFIRNRGDLSLTLTVRDAGSKESEVKATAGFNGPHCPTFTPDGLRVIYANAEDGRQAIFSVDPNGGDRNIIIDGRGANNWPSVTPDGKRLVFGSSRDGNFEIYAADLDGSHTIRLTKSPRMDIRPRVSPDGNRIAFTSNRDGNYDVYVMDLDGSKLIRVTNTPERDDYPAWHPDGRRLVVVSERSGKFDLFLIDVPDPTSKKGGGLGHDRHARQLVPADRLNESLDFKTHACSGCGQPLILNHGRSSLAPSG